MTPDESYIIEQALAEPGNISDNVDNACRSILRRRVQYADQPDREMRFLLEEFISGLTFKVEYRAVSGAASSSRRRRAAGLIAALSVVMVLCVIWSCSAEATWAKVIASILTAGSGIGLGVSLYGGQAAGSTAEPRLQPVTATRDIADEVDRIYLSIEKIFAHRQIEGFQKGILRWLQELYADSESESMRGSIKRLFSRYGYSLCDFSPERTSFFEMSVGPVDTIVTTMPAIVNDKGESVNRGNAVMPRLREAE